MSSSIDPVLASRDLLKQRTWSWPRLLAYGGVFAVTLLMFAWQAQFPQTDFWVHATIASEFNFVDLHSITSRLAYPAWHLCVALLYRLGVPLVWAASLVCALCKVAGMMLTYLLLSALLQDRIRRGWITLAGFLLMFVTGLLIPGVNNHVYQGIGSPTVWHNPTYVAATVPMLLCVPYTAHCWYEFQRRLPQQGSKTLLPWHMVVILAALLMLSLACKPTFMQAFLPACFVFFLAEWIRHPKNSRFFLQMILAFLPAVLYFLLQYLYYTGVLVPFTSGVEVGATAESAWFALRSILIMAAFPLYSLICFYQKGLYKDRMLVITLLTVLFSLLESMFFRETGMREGHGNFHWGVMSSALMLWVLMLARFLDSFQAYRLQGQKTALRSISYGIGFALLGWHVFSGGYYLWFLLSTGNAF